MISMRPHLLLLALLHACSAQPIPDDYVSMPADIDSVTLTVTNNGQDYSLDLHGGGDEPNEFSARMNAKVFEGDTDFTAEAHSDS